KSAAVEYLISGRTSIAATPFVHVTLPSLSSRSLSGYGKNDKDRRGEDMETLRTWWMDRMVRTDRPLEEKMTLFWHGLFCSGFKEVREADFMVQQNQLLRKEAVGNYKRLAHEMVHDPAMLRYLNADQNVRGKPNENLAREMMEL